MKLLIISKIFPNKLQPTFGTFVLDETQALVKNNEVRVVAPVPWFPRLKRFKRWYLFSQIPDKEVIDGIWVAHPRYLVTPKIGRSLYGLFYIWGIRRTIRKIWAEFKFDEIISHYAYPTGYAAAYVKRKYQRPLLLKTHGSDIHEDIQYPSRKIGTIKALQSADRIIAVCQALKKKIHQQKIPDEQVSVIYNAVNLRDFHVLNQQECRRQLSLPRDHLLILFVGNLIPVKNLPMLINAFHHLKKKLAMKAKLLIIGEGILRLNLESMVHSKGLNSYIQFIGAQPHDKIPLWMNACDVLCLSSKEEGYPTVLNEAKACGLPFVATDVGGVNEIADRFDIVVPPNDVHAYAQGMLRLIEHKQTNSYQRISRYTRSWQNVAEEMEIELDRLVKNNGQYK